MKRPMSVLLVITLWVAAQLFATAHQVTVWRSESSLWANAVRQAPWKPRPLLNYGRALILQGRFADAEYAFQQATALATQPHVPSYDRLDALQAARANMETIRIMQLLAAVE